MTSHQRCKTDLIASIITRRLNKRSKNIILILFYSTSSFVVARNCGHGIFKPKLLKMSQSPTQSASKRSFNLRHSNLGHLDRIAQVAGTG